MILGDYLLNNIFVEKRHAVFTMFFLGLYFTYQISIYYMSGIVVYYFATFDSLSSWLMTLGMGLVFYSVHLMFAAISAYRLQR